MQKALGIRHLARVKADEANATNPPTAMFSKCLPLMPDA